MDKEKFVKNIRKDLGIKTYQEMGESADLNLNFKFDDNEMEEIRKEFFKKTKKKNQL